MRLKTYSAPTIPQALSLVRADLGDGAIIVSTQKRSTGVRVTAAIEAAELPPRPVSQPISAAPSSIELLRDALAWHNTPQPLADRLLASAAAVASGQPALALAAALDTALRFAPLPQRCERPLLCVGPPGSGKTSTVAKLAARAVLAGQTVSVLSADGQSAGGAAQLAAFTRILGIELLHAPDPGALAALLQRRQRADLVVIDSAAVNPFDDTDMARLAGLIEAVQADPVLVLAVGGDAADAAEIAQAFAEMKVARAVFTRLDVARRLGGLLAAADAGRLKLAEVGVSPRIAEGLAAVNPVALARLLIPGNLAALRAAKGASDGAER
jgi:flagellar biosynthesis protein FlhF